MGLSPRAFYGKWGVSYDTIAAICARVPVTVRRWFKRGQEYRAPNTSNRWHLTLMDFLLEHFETMPPDLLQTLYPELPITASQPNDEGSTEACTFQDPMDRSFPNYAAYGERTFLAIAHFQIHVIQGISTMVQRQADAEGHRVAAEIRRIQKALNAAGFRMRKQPPTFCLRYQYPRAVP